MTYDWFHPSVIEMYSKLQLHVEQCLHKWDFSMTNDINICNNFP